MNLKLNITIDRCCIFKVKCEIEGEYLDPQNVFVYCFSEVYDCAMNL